MKKYVLFLTHRLRAERALGAYIAETLVAGNSIPESIVRDGVATTTHSDPTALVAMARISHKTRLAALRELRARWPKRVDPDDAPELTDEWFESAELKIGDKVVRRGL